MKVMIQGVSLTLFLKLDTLNLGNIVDALADQICYTKKQPVERDTD